MFQITHYEAPVLVSALTIAINTYKDRLKNDELSGLHEETTVHLRMAEHMLDRLLAN